ncbi:MAG: SDR family NAD(P)-dependent oxidoreductase [Cyclobacteriaceae bacterium]
MEAFDLTGKVAVVTGGGSGIGESIAKVLAQRGAVVHILEREVENGEKVVADIKNDQHQAYLHPVDVSRKQQVTAAIDTVINVSKTIDILVNNAGIAHVGNLETTSEADLDRVYQVNVKGVYLSMHATVPIMKQNGGGAIINMASTASAIGLPDRLAYTMSKGAVLTMTFSVARDYLHDGIRCNAIGPGRTHTPFVDGFIKKNYPGKEDEMFKKLSLDQPIGRMAQPEEIAGLVAYLCSDQASFITGSFYPIDGGVLTLNH